MTHRERNMPDDPVLADLLHQAGEHFQMLIRQAFEAGQKAGEETARAKVLIVFGAAPEAPVAPIAPIARPRKTPTASVGGTGANNAVRHAMGVMTVPTEGVGPAEVHEFVSRQLTTTRPLSMEQVRTALKVLARQNQIERIVRGRYRPIGHLSNRELPRERIELPADSPEPSGSEIGPVKTELLFRPTANGATPV
jgi:hypothetical protein